MNKEISKLLTSVEVAKLLGVTLGTIMRWRTIPDHPLKFIKEKGFIRYRYEDVASFLEPAQNRINDKTSS